MQIMQYVIGCTWIRIRNKYRMFIPNKHVVLYLSFVNSKNPDDYENSIVIVSQSFFVTCIQKNNVNLIIIITYTRISVFVRSRASPKTTTNINLPDEPLGAPGTINPSPGEIALRLISDLTCA